jgi:hypothetical protein
VLDGIRRYYPPHKNSDPFHSLGIRVTGLLILYSFVAGLLRTDHSTCESGTIIQNGSNQNRQLIN